MELSNQSRHLKMRNVPAAQMVAQRPSALKCFSRNVCFNWAQIGPQVNSDSRFALPQKFGQTELSTVSRHLKKRNCSCDPNLRSGSSRADDTVPLGVCCLSTASSRDRIVGHPLFLASDDQIIRVTCDLPQKPARCRILELAHRVPSQRVGHNISQLNHITCVRFSDSRIEATCRMNCSVTPLQCGFKLLLRALAFDFGVAPQISQWQLWKESVRQFQRHTLMAQCRALQKFRFWQQNERAHSQIQLLRQLQNFQSLSITIHQVSMKFFVALHPKFRAQTRTRLIPSLGIVQCRHTEDEWFIRFFGFARPIASSVELLWHILKTNGASLGPIKWKMQFSLW